METCQALSCEQMDYILTGVVSSLKFGALAECHRPAASKAGAKKSYIIGSKRQLEPPSFTSTFVFKLVMDAAFMPSEIVVKHFVHHKFTLELGPSIISLGRGVRNVILAGIVIYVVGDIVRGSLQAVLKRKSRGDTKD